MFAYVCCKPIRMYTRRFSFVLRISLQYQLILCTVNQPHVRHATSHKPHLDHPSCNSSLHH